MSIEQINIEHDDEKLKERFNLFKTKLLNDESQIIKKLTDKLDITVEEDSEAHVARLVFKFRSSWEVCSFEQSKTKEGQYLIYCYIHYNGLHGNLCIYLLKLLAEFERVGEYLNADMAIKLNHVEQFDLIQEILEESLLWDLSYKAMDDIILNDLGKLLSGVRTIMSDINYNAYPYRYYELVEDMITLIELHNKMAGKRIQGKNDTYQHFDDNDTKKYAELFSKILKKAITH